MPTLRIELRSSALQAGAWTTTAKSALRKMGRCAGLEPGISRATASRPSLWTNTAMRTSLHPSVEGVNGFEPSGRFRRSTAHQEQGLRVSHLRPGEASRDDRNRTGDLTLIRRALYRSAELRPSGLYENRTRLAAVTGQSPHQMRNRPSFYCVSRRLDLNQRSHAPEACAIPDFATPRCTTPSRADWI